MSVCKNEENQVTVTLYDMHYGHDMDLQHLRISLSDRQNIASQIRSGVSMEYIFDSIRESIDGFNDIERLHLISKKDLVNIEKSFGLKMERHSNDSVSVKLFLQELNETVLFTKFQNESSQEGLGFDDIMIVIQTPLQKEMMMIFSNQRVVCMDATHGTNTYDFYLITILVIDEFGEGFPTAWCITNKEDETSITVFLAKVKSNIGSVTQHASCQTWLINTTTHGVKCSTRLRSYYASGM